MRDPERASCSSSRQIARPPDSRQLARYARRHKASPPFTGTRHHSCDVTLKAREELAMKTMLLATALATGLILWNACGLESATVYGSEGPAAAEDGPQELAIHTTCAVIGDAELADRANVEVYRHVTEPGTLGLSIRKLPMTCADRVKVFADWALDDGGALTLDVSGEGYQRCLCSVDFEPFTVAVPPAAEGRLDDFMLIIRRSDTSDAGALQAMTIGSLTYQ
jgi:hypothetical protein